MSKQVLFIQGGGAGVHDGWDNKLVESLARESGPTYEISYPRMPDEADPTYAAWKAALEHQIAALDDGAILIGHSVGGITCRDYAHRAPLAFETIMTLPQPSAFSALSKGYDGECPCCRRRFADAF